MKRDRNFVEGVKWAALIERPSCIPLPRSQKGAKAAGLRYERLFAKQFPQALHGQWFEYEDKFGHGYCQPDLIVSLLPKCLVVFEVKYTLTLEAFLQLNHLYLPVVQAAMNAPVIGIVVARNLTETDVEVAATLDYAIAVALTSPGHIPVLHWVGQSVACQTHILHCKPTDPVQFASPARNRVCEPSAPLVDMV